MCVSDDFGKSLKQLKQKYGRKQHFIGYKVVEKMYSSADFRTTVQGQIIKPGVIEARNNKNEKVSTGITGDGYYDHGDNRHSGIHIYRTKKAAKAQEASYHYLIRVICDVNDIITSDVNQIALTKVFILADHFRLDTKLQILSRKGMS